MRFVLDSPCLTPGPAGAADGGEVEAARAAAAAGGGDDDGDYAAWAARMEQLAACDNLVGVKLAGVEEWGVRDPAKYVPSRGAGWRGVGDEAEAPPSRRYIKGALRAFGFGRCMAGSNWFVCETLTGDRASYMESYVRLRAACLDLGATDAEMRAVFHDNARRVYGL